MEVSDLRNRLTGNYVSSTVASMPLRMSERPDRHRTVGHLHETESQASPESQAPSRHNLMTTSPAW